MNAQPPMESPGETLARLFVGRADVLGTYDPATGRVWQVKRAVCLADYEKHWRGTSPLGIYPLVEDRVRFAAADFDTPDTVMVLSFAREMGRRGWAPHVELSKSKGFHCWFFFAQPALAHSVRAVLHDALTTVGASGIEVFPKQDRLNPDEFGNFINLPLFGRTVEIGKTVFVNGAFAVIKNQWAYLRGAKLSPIPAPPGATPPMPVPLIAGGATQYTWGLMPCMQRMLNEGVTEYQRVSCFRLAVALRKTGLPADAAQDVLVGWASKNRPAQGKRQITPGEIAGQLRSAYQGRLYLGHGCEDPAVAPFCVPTCHIKRSAVS